jgi:hypothetical protein
VLNHELSFTEPAGPEASEDEVRAWVLNNTRLDDQGIEQALAELADPTYDSYSDTSVLFPSRRGLEGALAAWHAVDPLEFKHRNVQRTWTALWQEASQLDADNRNSLGALRHLACLAETNCRPAQTTNDSSDGTVRDRPAEDYPELADALAEVGPGARSGLLSDYTRTELRKLLGFLQRECSHLSDADLLGMALDGHLVPRWRGAHAHARLAAEYAAHQTGSLPDRPKLFRKAMRMSYGTLSSGPWVTYRDNGRRSESQLRALLAERHPVYAGCEQLKSHLLLDICKRNGISHARPETERYRAADGAADKLATPLDLRYRQAFDDFIASFGGARKLGQIKGSLVRKNTLGYRTIPTGCLAYYDPPTGNIHLNTAYAAKLRRNALEPREIERTVNTIAHELFHAIEPWDSGSDATGMKNSATPEHTDDEGRVEAAAALHAQDLAERMGLWDAGAGDLRDHSNGCAYPREVETMVTLTAACCGELDHHRLRNGDYADPFVLSPRARKHLVDRLVDHGPFARITATAEELSAQGLRGGDQDERRDAVLLVLSECKSDRYQRKLRKSDASARESWTEVPPKPFSSRLSDVLREVGL